MEPAAATNWIPGLAVLGTAIVAGVAYLLLGRTKADAPNAPAALEDFEAQYQSLVAQLKEHAQTKHLVDAETWAAQRTALEKKAANVLRERDQVKHDAQKAAARAQKLATQATARLPLVARAAIVVVLVAGFFGMLTYVMNQATVERAGNMSLTGGAPGEGGPAEQAGPSPADDPKFVALAARVRDNSEDVDALADMSIYLLRWQAFDEARGFVMHATEIDPFHTKARVARTVLDAVDHDPAAAADELRRLALTYPEAHDASMFEGLIAVDQQQPSRAIEALERYQTTAPAGEAPPFVQMQLNALKQAKTSNTGNMQP